MAVKKIETEEFVELASECPVIDARSPGEFAHANIPGAYSLPLFSDEERKVIGTLYKQESREKAIKQGLDYFGVKMRRMVEEVEKLSEDRNTRTVLVHCWRGGMRSGAVAWLLDLYGFKVYQLTGGYKSFRHWVLKQFERDFAFNIVGGYTGSGKTIVLQQLKQLGVPVIDLEGLAHHKGSAFGAIDMPEQPSQEMFENKLALQLFHNATTDIPFYTEDESQRIGLVNIPNSFWKQMREKKIFFLDVPFEERLKYLSEDYGKGDRDKLVNAIIRIKKRLGGLETKTAINHLLEDNIVECFRVLLFYYDKLYKKGLEKRDNWQELLTEIDCDKVDAKVNAAKILTTEKASFNA
jgi:tRNA 2-selenouridine synthase